jgi:DNA-binding response OmpR family regulator
MKGRIEMSAKIMVVDDSPNTLRVVGYALEAEGYEVMTAETGAEALEKISAEQPHLVVLDIILPDMTGLQVCHQLRSKVETAEIPIVMLTGKDQIPDKIRGLQAGADAYIVKPVKASTVVATVVEALEETQTLASEQPAKVSSQEALPPSEAPANGGD